MTPQEQRNKRFDEKFQFVDLFEDSRKFCDHVQDEVKSHLTSEVNLTIEQVEKWIEETPKIQDIWTGDTIKVDDLLSFLKELKK